jgi:hypothetical protein
MKRRPKKIDEQGHLPIPHDSGRGVECTNCHNTRLNGHPWRHKCTQTDAPKRKYMAEG